MYKRDDGNLSRSMRCLVSSYHCAVSKVKESMSDLAGGLTLLNVSSHHGTNLHFVSASVHERRASLVSKESIHSSCFSTSSCGTFSDDDDSSSFSTEDSFEDGSSFAGDDEDPVQVTGVDEAKNNGFFFSLEDIQKMRVGKTISEVELSPPKENEITTESLSVHPRETYKKILMDETGSFSQRSYLVVPAGFFVKGDEKAHTLELMTAVRKGDLKTIKQLRTRGFKLQCCNKFNETIIHTAARRGEFGVLQYLLRDAGVSPRV